MKKKTMIVFLGPPGSGKGTQADSVSEKTGLPKISVGGIFRREIASGSKIGKKVEERIEKGKLITTDLTNELLSKELASINSDSGFILDGYPRKEDQIEYTQSKIDEFLEHGGSAFVIYIDITDNVVKERIGGRRSCSCGESFHIKYDPPKEMGICDTCGKQLFQREDDSDEAVEKRLEIFHKENEPILDYFKDKDCFYKINGKQPIKEVEKEIFDLLNLGE